MTVRRVVTGHTPEGRAVVLSDQALAFQPGRAAVESRVIWSSEGFPVDISGDEDGGERVVGISHPNGTVFRIVDFHPGNAPMSHRTETIDYAVVMSGEIDMELEPGEFIHLEAGDVLVQRGTIHNWVNRGDEVCRIAFVLIAAEPVVAGGQPLTEHGVYSYPPTAAGEHAT